MSSIQSILSAYAVPLQIWLTPESRKRAADALLGAFQNHADVNINPLVALSELNGPAVVVIAASELEGPRKEDLRSLIQRAHPGRAVLIGGTSDRDVLMAGINDWGVVRVVPMDADDETIVAAVRAAGSNLKREVALESAIEDLDIETTMLESAIDHLDASRIAANERTKGNASNTLSEGLVGALKREGDVVRDLSTQEPGLALAIRGIDALTHVVQHAGDRAIERSAGLPYAAEELDNTVLGFRDIWIAQNDADLTGHIGTGAKTTVDPFALTSLLLQLCQQRDGSVPISIDAYRAGTAAVIDIAFSGHAPSNLPDGFEGVGVRSVDNDQSRIQLTITIGTPNG